MKFMLEIELGNDAMRDDADIAEALARVAKRVETIGTEYNRAFVIRDTNGNTVGRWSVVTDPV